MATTVSAPVRETLIERWLPVTELGIDAGRERRAIGHLPPLFLIHLWWARRPVGAAQGVQVAALLPPWSESLLDQVEGLRDALDATTYLPADSDEGRYRNWVLWVCGIRGDNVEGQRRYELGESAGAAWAWEKAWQARPYARDLQVLHRLLTRTWGRVPAVLDPTAGGGSIPYAAIRYGLHAVANDLNPVAVAAMLGSVAVPGALGSAGRSLAEEWGRKLCERLEASLSPYFPPHADGLVPEAYIFANAIECPRTRGPVPLVPNWWLVNKGKAKKVARPVYHRDDAGRPSHITFDICDAGDVEEDPSLGTVKGGEAVSPWDELPIDRDEIKRQAQDGRMFAMLYAVKVRGGRGEWEVRHPTRDDIDGLARAADELARREPGWAASDVIPTEEVPPPIPKHDIRPYGFEHWRDFFTPRQLLVHGTFVEKWREVADEARAELAEEDAEAVMATLAMMQAKALDYNSRSTEWTPAKNGFSHMFARHDFSFKWTFAEYEGASRLWQRGLNAELLPYLDRIVSGTSVDSGQGLFEDDVSEASPSVPGPLTLSLSSGSDLPYLEDGSVECVNIDPPYYDNVMYAELADFFYVWEKRTLGQLFPDRFKSELTDKDNEAVANIARFDFAKGKQRKALADSDYESKMRDIFAESRRVLRDDGVLVVWFTHKRAEAWDTLGAALMDAGFTIETSWPVNTEAQVSLHQTNVNAAKSTIVLVCRKRLVDDTSKVFFEDIEASLRAAARQGAEDFEPIVGHGGVDLMLSTYGPTLSVLSRRWPVYRSEADASGNLVPIRPEEALDIARAEVAKLRIARLVGHERRFDPITDFVVLSWSLFADVGFPFDEARKLALGVGADVNGLIDGKVLAKKGSNVSLVDPRDRVQRRLKPEGPFSNLYDAVSVMLRLYTTDGAGSVRSWLVEHGYEHSTEFKEAVLALANAVPRVQDQDGEWSVELAEVIDEVATNVPTLGLRLADVERSVATPVAQQETLAFGLET
ncbi:MAG: DUF1156 domain-containing protein [Nitriliruptoraceae bacterium]|nr:DUF1156 domain-containing protein [Nitriliruptoraceae bacterium]